ncbi:DnaJ family domain-containing protein [Rhodococcus sp. NPDC003348]
MTERKPWNVPFESWVERQIRLAQERGEFDNLAGAGKPLPPIDDSDELWWVKRKLAAEGLSTEALLPPSLQLRREVERLSDVVADLPTEQAVREAVADLNRRIADYLRAPSVPVVPVHKVDADRAVATWRGHRPGR